MVALGETMTPVLHTVRVQRIYFACFKTRSCSAFFFAVAAAARDDLKSKGIAFDGVMRGRPSFFEPL